MQGARWLIWVMALIAVSGCGAAAGTTRDDGVAAAPTATAVPLTATHTPLPTATLPPTETATTTATTTMTATPAPTDTPTRTVTPVSPPATATTAVDRRCPHPPPPKPAYDRYYLSGRPWPTPDPAAVTPHFWLSKPLVGDGRFTINQTYPYGYDGGGRYLLHNGIDVAAPLGTPVLAAADGTVIVAQSDAEENFGWRCDWYGHLVILQLDETWLGQPMFALYGHVINLSVAVGQRVQQGQPVAEVGVGGAAVVPHLHFELRVGENSFGTTRNPMLWFEPGPRRGVLAGRLIDPQGRPWQGVTVTLISHQEEPRFINTWSYLGDAQDLIQPDEGLAENFLFADVRPGSYDLYVKLQGVEYRTAVDVVAGQLTQIEIVTEAYKKPTPAPAVTVTPADG